MLIFLRTNLPQFITSAFTMHIKIELYIMTLGSFILVNQGDATFAFWQVFPS